MDHIEQPRGRPVLRNALLFLFCIAPLLGFAGPLFGFNIWSVYGFQGLFTLSVAALGGWTLTSLIISGSRERIDWFPLILVGLVTCLWVYVRIRHPFR